MAADMPDMDAWQDLRVTVQVLDLMVAVGQRSEIVVGHIVSQLQELPRGVLRGR